MFGKKIGDYTDMEIAKEIANRLCDSVEKAEKCKDALKPTDWSTFVVIAALMPHIAEASIELIVNLRRISLANNYTCDFSKERIGVIDDTIVAFNRSIKETESVIKEYRSRGNAEVTE